MSSHPTSREAAIQSSTGASVAAWTGLCTVSSMGKTFMTAGLLLAMGCGGNDGATPGTDFTCDPATDRNGTYLVHLVERPGGSCGELPDTLGRIDGGMPVQGPSQQCSPVAPSKFSQGNCKLENVFRCTSSDGSVVDATAVTTQLDADGAKLSGIYSASATRPGGASCTSSYDVTYTRQ